MAKKSLQEKGKARKGVSGSDTSSGACGKGYWAAACVLGIVVAAAGCGAVLLRGDPDPYGPPVQIFDVRTHNPDGHPERVTEMIRRSGGRVSDKFDIVSAEGKGQYAVATADIAEGEEIYYSPWNGLLPGKGDPAKPNEKKEKTADQALMTFLLNQKRKLEHTGACEFEAYIRELPSLGQHRNAMDVTGVAKTCLSVGASTENAKFVKSFTAISARIRKAKPEWGREPFSDDEMLWAYSNVVSRHTYFSEFHVSYLLPVWDFFNHDSKRFNIESRATKNGGVSMIANRKIAKGEDLFITYGTHISPYKMMAYYGFVDKSKEEVRSLLSFMEDPLMTKYGCVDQDKINVFVNGSLTRATEKCLALATLTGEQRQKFQKMSPDAQRDLLSAQRAQALEAYISYAEDIITQGHPVPTKACLAEERREKAAGQSDTTLQMVLEHGRHLRSIYQKVRKTQLQELNSLHTKKRRRSKMQTE
eukprot:TRINITY_DN331_c4_g1_i1.p1 TRINITY_DN331_c4_g1~~TRINITY_DN331_c4_g1_i1.p1  ORF type:complete len:493 (+),score=185.73 TRINITY_DN331_c4_g1_i1:56-1480(+)